MNINYKQILSYWSSIAYNHEQINSFGFGDIEQCTNDIVTQQEPKYTRMYIVPQQVTLNQNEIHYNFSVIIMDKVDDDLSNLQEVMSDTLEIARDVWTVFYQSYTQQQGDFADIIQGDWDADVDPFTERFETILGGWTLNISMSAPFDYNSCVIPDTDVFTQDESFSSYYQIITDWKNFADNHEQIRSFGFGDITQLTNDVITKQEPRYPRLYFVPERTKLQQNHMHITWKVIMCDKLDDDLSNLQDVLSDNLEIIKDFFARTYLSDYEADWNASVEPFVERTESILGGWTLTISITQKSDYNRCVLPVLPFGAGITWEELAKLWKDVDEHWADVRKTN
jgi:hypothetical protein